MSDVVAGELEYYERKIFKGTEPPENPQNDTLWYDTSNQMLQYYEDIGTENG